MVFKVVSGVSANGSSSSQLWSSSETINENEREALNVNSSFRAHYKNLFVPNWRTIDPKEVSLKNNYIFQSLMRSFHCHIRVDLGNTLETT